MRRAYLGRPVAVGASALCFLVLIAGPLLLPVRSEAVDSPAPAPKKKDSRSRFQSKNAKLTTSVEPAEARQGELVTFKVTAKVDPGYHIYKYSRESARPGAGPLPTTFDLFDTGGLRPEGDWVAEREPIQHPEPAFPDIPFVEYYEDEVSWSIKLKVPSDATPGKKTLRVQAGYMVCNASSCSMAGQWTLPEATLTVISGGSGGPPSTAAATPTPKPEAPKPVAPPTSEKPAVASPPPVVASTGSAIRSEIAQKAEQGLIPFLIASALGGLFALVMPCVWPMVPITVNFFVKQGQSQSGRVGTTGLAVTYCLSIIGVFTAVGVLCSFFFSASALQTLANNAWLNIFVAVMFLVFGMSLLGMFEIRLPSVLLNASSQGENRGGLVGVMFMALTLTITSFTCTFPVVGGLLAMAAGGDFFYPIVGLATFSAVLALPFFVLALSPGMISRMPRGGDWMNAVKVVGGLVEIGAALKFINTAEQSFVPAEDAWMNAPMMLTCWIALATVCGVYLLGLFRTDHDHDEVKVGAGRMLTGAAFLGLALFLTPALFGHSPKGPLWNRIIVGLLPPDISELIAPQVAMSGGDSSPEIQRATSTDPDEAERQQKSFHGVQWGMSLAQAKEQAARENRPILIDFTGVNCTNCRQMEIGVFPNRQVLPLLKRFVTVQLYTDFVKIPSLTPLQWTERAEINQDLLLKLTGEATNPIYVVLSPDGRVVDRIGGFNEPRVFAAFLTQALEKAGGGSEKVAQAAGKNGASDR